MYPNSIGENNIPKQIYRFLLILYFFFIYFIKCLFMLPFEVNIDRNIFEASYIYINNDTIQ